jgi:hypothetical protein
MERCVADSFDEAFPEQGTFTSKEIKGRRYWYFQVQTESGRSQRYVGPESPQLMEQIEHHKKGRSDERERRALVSTLVRSHGLPRPVSEIGDIVEALARAGVFRLRSVLVGTVAYQAYSSMLGVKLSGALLQTSDIDIAQFRNVSIAVEDRTPPMLDVLKTVDKTFRVVPHLRERDRVTSYAAKGGLRVDFLTPNEGADTDDPQDLPALQTDAEPLRFLDFLIHDPERAVLLHSAGVLVNVPAPQRFAIHKLIVARRRRTGSAKGDKDLQQAGALLEFLAQKRSQDLKLAWSEAYDRGKKWRQLLLEGLGQIAAYSRDVTLKAISVNRESIPSMDLTFTSESGRYVPRYDTHRDVVLFTGEAMGSPVSCAISREALNDHFGADGRDAKGRLDIFLKNRSKIQSMARTMYLSWPVQEPEAVLITTMDVEKL